jgi:hypothetical protein
VKWVYDFSNACARLFGRSGKIEQGKIQNDQEKRRQVL